VRSPLDGSVALVPRLADNGRTQLGTGFNELTADGRITLRPAAAHELTVASQAYRQFDAPRTDQCAPPFARADECVTFREQFRTLTWAKWKVHLEGGLEQFELGASWQRQHEVREGARPASFVLTTGRDVVDTLGVPVSGVPVSVVPRGAEPAVTDAQGQFTIAPLRPGVLYAIRVAQRGFDQQERVTSKPGGPAVRVVVRRQPVFRGRVLGDGQPLKNFRVDEHEVTSADGRFELPLPSTDDKVIIAVEAPGYEPMMAAYRHAIAQRYRFFSYGDAMLLARGAH
jgi:hypothetical protein